MSAVMQPLRVTPGRACPSVVVPKLEARVSVVTEAGEATDIARAQRGDAEAFARLIATHQAGIARLMWRFTRQPEDQEELVQEVFVTAYLNLSSFRGRGRFANWLRAIAVRTGYDYWRRRKRDRVDYPGEVEELVDRVRQDNDPTDALVAGDLVHRLLGKLSDRDRLVLTLLHLEGCSVEQISELTGWSKTMVKVQAHRARARLRKLVEAGESQ